METNNDFFKKLLMQMNIEELLEYRDFVINKIKMNNEIIEIIEEILEERNI